MEKPIRIILAEDQELFRTSLAAYLQMVEDFEVAGEVSNGRELLDLLKIKAADVVLLDIEMPVMDGKAALKVMKNRFPNIKVIILTMYTGRELAMDYMAMGANGFLSKGSGSDVLINAIRNIQHESFFYDIGNADPGDSTNFSPRGEEAIFSDRETEILKNICEGKTNREIASYLNLSASTIDFYKGKIYSKTKCNNATGLLRYALMNGIINIPHRQVG
jgi:DNA-binding NarL/FixJ family response regulator